MAVVHARSWRVVYACLFGVASRSVTPVMVDLWSPFSSISHLAQLRSAEQEAPAVVGGGGDAVHRCPVRAGGDAAAAQQGMRDDSDEGKRRPQPRVACRSYPAAAFPCVRAGADEGI